MGKLRTLIVDDESLARRGLRLRLQKHPRIEVVAECQNGREALAAVAEHQAELLFLDIQMPGMDGFEVVRRLQDEAMPMVVFVTAFDHYAVEAFEVHAVDYVLKPVDEDRLAVTVARVFERFAARHSEGEKQRLIELVAQITGETAGHLENLAFDGALGHAQQRLVIKDGSTIHRVPWDDIEWIDAAGDYMCIHAAGATHVTRATMKELEAGLDPQRFVRIHRSTLVNLERVESIAPLENGKYRIGLRGGQMLTMSRGYRDQLAQLAGHTG
ncbi:MAG: Transcriptional regulatory protein BtsR [Pseudomonadales bacterium]|nr:Transcriptional regulatory protein BtsR [Pseudomonadales bacterium]